MDFNRIEEELQNLRLGEYGKIPSAIQIRLFGYKVFRGIYTQFIPSSRTVKIWRKGREEEISYRELEEIICRKLFLTLEDCARDMLKWHRYWDAAHSYSHLHLSEIFAVG